MGLTELGYQRRTYDDILNAKIQRAKELFGEDIDTSDQTIFGKILRINAYDQALTEEANEAVYYSRFPNSALGTSLDRLMPFAAMSRNAAEAASYSVRIEGTPGYTVEAGFLVGTETELTFYTVRDATIGEDGTCLVEVCCTEAGTDGNINASAIDTVTNPNADVTSVAGVECLSPGVDGESDAELRARFHAALAGSGSSSTNAIRASLLRIPTVQYAAVLENDTDEEDSEGRPPHSFECYVLGGEDYSQEIAEAIFEKRPIGVQTTGDEAITITDASGNEKVVRFSRALNVRIMVRVQVSTDATFTGDGASEIYTNVAEYINSLGIGKSLVLSALYGHIYNVQGVTEVVSLELSTDGGASYGTSNIPVPMYGVAVCAAVDVEVVA